MSRHARIYNGKRWRDLRKVQLQQEPLCRYCAAMGRTTPATVVDHIRPHRGDDALAYAPENLQSLCKSCHDIHADAKDRGKVLAGCDEQGFPLDGAHAWGVAP